MITGVHGLIYTRQAEAVRNFLRETLGWDNVDGGGGWPIFAMPPAEVGVHPHEGESFHELYLMCDDIEATRAELTAKGVEFDGPVRDEGWGLVSTMKIADGETMMVYQPRHPTAISGTAPG